MSRPFEPVGPRILSKIIRREGCWGWSSVKDRAGYPMIWNNGKLRRAGRLAYPLLKGVEPGDLWVLHHCDNPECLNPDHLYLGTRSDNARDMSVRQRNCAKKPAHVGFRKGAGHILAKLTEERVAKLREEFSVGGITQEAMAKREGISQGSLSMLLRRKNWKHVV